MKPGRQNAILEIIAERDIETQHQFLKFESSIEEIYIYFTTSISSSSTVTISPS